MSQTNFVITDPVGRCFNLSNAWEYWLELEKEEQYPAGTFPKDYSVATLNAKTVTGSVQRFPGQTINSLIESIMPGLNIDLFEGFNVEPSGAFWYDTDGQVRNTIQPTFTLLGAIIGSRHRKLLDESPEAANWSLNEQVKAINERGIQPEVMKVEGLPYLIAISTGNRLGVRFFKNADHVLDMLDEAYPGCVSQHEHASFIEANIKKPFEEEKRLRRERAQAQQQQRAKQQGIHLVHARKGK